MTPKRRFIIGLALIVITIITLAVHSCRQRTDDTAYMTEKAFWGTISRIVSATGEVGAVQLVTVGAQVSGQITKLHVIVGQEIKKGDLVAELDSVPQLNQLETDQALLQSYQAQLAAKQVSMRMAKTQYEREKALRSKDAASLESLENLENTYALAQAETSVLESQIRQTQLAVSTDEVNLSYTRITAPLDGIVVSVPVDEGQTVNAAQTTPTIAQIADLSRMELKVEISEGDITAVKPGMPIVYTILSEPDEKRHAKLTSIDPGLTTLTDGTYKSTSTSNSTSSSTTSEAIYYYGKVLIDNSDGRLRIGMTTQVDITISSAEHALLVPLMAVHTAPDGTKSLRIKTAKGMAGRTISIGMNDGVNVQVLTGLQEGEEIITDQISQTDIDAQSQRRMRGPF